MSRATRIAAVVVAAILGSAAWTGARAQTADPCHVDLRGGMAVPVSGIDEPWETEMILGAGLSCGGDWRLGGTAELANVGAARLWSLMGEVRRLFADARGPRPLWWSVGGGAGWYTARQKGARLAILPAGTVDLPDYGDGFALGGSGRLGYSGPEDWSVFLDLAVRLAFVDTARFEDGSFVRDRTSALWVFPITAGVRVGL